MSLDEEAFSKEIRAFDIKRLEEELDELKSLEDSVASCERIQIRIYLLEQELKRRRS
jgi:trans-2-enoyl-CoA reductase